MAKSVPCPIASVGLAIEEHPDGLYPMLINGRGITFPFISKMPRAV